jgi:adenylate kinase
VDIPNTEVMTRLLKRGRSDDIEENIKERLVWFKRDVGPVIDYYEKAGRLHKIDGVGSVEEIAERIAQALGI